MQLPLRLPEPGPLLSYIQWLSATDRNKAEDIVKMVAEALRTPGGIILLELLQKSIELRPVEILADERALAARNAQAFIASDLRRIASNETERLLREADARSSGRAKRRNASG
jgi:hypothetical protein